MKTLNIRTALRAGYSLSQILPVQRWIASRNSGESDTLPKVVMMEPLLVSVPQSGYASNRH